MKICVVVASILYLTALLTVLITFGVPWLIIVGIVETSVMINVGTAIWWGMHVSGSEA